MVPRHLTTWADPEDIKTSIVFGPQKEGMSVLGLNMPFSEAFTLSLARRDQPIGYISPG